MPNAATDRKQLVHRVRRLRGQLDAVEQALLGDEETSALLQRLSACRGALSALVGEVVEVHVHRHLLDGREGRSSPRAKAAQELVEVVQRYLK